ncbi:MAG: amidase [Alphaproteobacteria bacterium]|nr:amidase [Alphaproteobacteria bacterium]
MDGYAGLDAMAQADLVKRGQATPAELAEAAIARIERLDGKLNAVVRKMYEEGRAEAGNPPAGPFRGVPFLIKDISINYKGVPTTAASKLGPLGPPQRDSELMARYRRAGLVTLGKTNLGEFGSLPTSESAMFGPCLSPWNTETIAGGSSGGAAAAVAARLVPVAQGGDGAGSIRIPASCSGVYGLKPTRGRITFGPELGEAIGGITNAHVLSWSVRDSAAVLDATEGPMPGDPYWAERPKRPYLHDVGAEPGRLRIAFTAHSMIGTKLHADCVAAVKDAAKLCESLGHVVEEAAPPLNAEEYDRIYRRFWPLIGAMGITRGARARGQHWANPADLEPFNAWLYEQARQINVIDYYLDLCWFHAMARDFARFLTGYDLWLTPTLGFPPPGLGHFDAGKLGGKVVMDRFMEFLPFTPFCNMTGQPAASIPLYWNAAGLPIGVHLVGQAGDEATIFKLSGQLERARPWAGRIPAVSALN